MTRSSLSVLALCACLAAGPALAAPPDAGADLPSLNFNPETGTFTQALPPERGWQAFADLLEKAAPSTNTAIPLTPAQVSGHAAALIDAGRATEALDIIGKQQAARDTLASPGTDVQLRYQQGRALAALDRHDEAMAVWRQMTTDYPELPEPWNALAIEYARQGQLQLARDALDMALVSDPSFAPALENLGHVQLRLAQESFERARAAGDKTAAPGAQ